MTMTTQLINHGFRRTMASAIPSPPLRGTAPLLSPPPDAPGRIVTDSSLGSSKRGPPQGTWQPPKHRRDGRGGCSVDHGNDPSPRRPLSPKHRLQQQRPHSPQHHSPLHPPHHARHHARHPHHGHHSLSSPNSPDHDAVPSFFNMTKQATVLRRSDARRNPYPDNSNSSRPSRLRTRSGARNLPPRGTRQRITQQPTGQSRPIRRS